MKLRRDRDRDRETYTFTYLPRAGRGDEGRGFGAPLGPLRARSTRAPDGSAPLPLRSRKAGTLLDEAKLFRDRPLMLMASPLLNMRRQIRPTAFQPAKPRTRMRSGRWPACRWRFCPPGSVPGPVLTIAGNRDGHTEPAVLDAEDHSPSRVLGTLAAGIDRPVLRTLIGSADACGREGTNDRAALAGFGAPISRRSRGHRRL